ncbi:MAG: hypothetical protein COW65_05210 [Cytophagales bacterium CG18_big_fil_WC_8_21_14_2_50_42_9]|nr:MAG: hypothetical protein COW65_05210 [Cytophagales bacterium CG18_big_fil_WC_8_21_14_2_50_42_9]
MKTNLVIQSFGRENEYKRAILTILSYYAYIRLTVDKTRVLLFTDKPEYFAAYLKDLPVDYILLTPAKIKSMRGQIDFLHRMKIALIEEAFSLINGNMLYTDSDTFFIADPNPVIQQVSPEKSFMHVWEHQFESLRNMPLPAGKTFRAFVELIESQNFQLADGREIKITPRYASWNAGVMMFHPTHARFIPDIYTLTDQFYPATQNHASEQYAFSIMLQENTDLEPCDSVIYHYWYRIKKQIVDLFLDTRLNITWAQLPLSDKLNQVKTWTMMLPAYFDEHVLTLRDLAIQSFNTNDFSTGYHQAFKALVKNPFSLGFMKDILYHTKRKINK